MTKFSTLGLVVALLLVGCSTGTVKQVQYYLLEQATPVASSELSIGQRQPLQLKLQLAKYLTRDNIAMQLPDHQLYYSSQHFWAEPLAQGISKALQADLNGQHSRYYVSTDSRHTFRPSQPVLHLRIDHLVATSASRVLLNGEYFVTYPNNPAKSQSTIQQFGLELPLTKDGYGHSVVMLRKLISALSRDIIHTLE